jgi:hypothetical protein
MRRTYAEVVSEWRSEGKIVKLPGSKKLYRKLHAEGAVAEGTVAGEAVAGKAVAEGAAIEGNILIYCRFLDYYKLSQLPTSCFLKYDINELLHILSRRVCDEEMWDSEWDDEDEYQYSKSMWEKITRQRQECRKIRYSKYNKCYNLLGSKFGSKGLRDRAFDPSTGSLYWIPVHQVGHLH